MKIVKPSAELLWITPDAELQIERAARTCYKSEDKMTVDSAAALITRLIKSGHHAMLEHASASFKFVCDRGVTHELVRHRLCAYAQESTRYCNYGKEKFGNEITVIKPPGLKEINDPLDPDRDTLMRWYNACMDAEFSYLELLKNNVPPQIARSVLPTCLKTEIVCTANLREWRHIFSLRLSSAAHPQIREIMYPASEILYHHCPSVFNDIMVRCTNN
jgi:thymidylate synthase (FAD)